MKKLSVILAVLVISLTACGKKSSVITLTYANFPPASTFPCVQMEQWKTAVEKATGGKVRINTFPDSTLLDAKNMIDGVIAGQADIGCLSMAYQPGRFIVTNALALPLGIKDAETGSIILNEIFAKYKPAEFANVKVLVLFANSPANVMSKKPVRTLADLRNMPLRASGGASEILKALNATPVGMPMSETPEAIQKGVVSGLFSSHEVLKDFNFANDCKYLTITDTVVYPFAVVMNMNKWNSLPDDVKKAMDGMSLSHAVWTGKYVDRHAAESLEWSKKEHRLEVIQLSDKEKKAMQGKLVPLVDTWIKDSSAKGIPAKEIVADIKKLVEKSGEKK